MSRSLLGRAGFLGLEWRSMWLERMWFCYWNCQSFECKMERNCCGSPLVALGQAYAETDCQRNGGHQDQPDNQT